MNQSVSVLAQHFVCAYKSDCQVSYETKHAMSFSLFGSVLDLQQFSVQTHFWYVGTGLLHDKISHGTAAFNV